MEMVKTTTPLFPALPQEAQIIVGGDMSITTYSSSFYKHCVVLGLPEHIVK
jgi:hypothetical protein